MHVPQSTKSKGSWILVGATLQFLGFAALYKSVLEADLKDNPKASTKKSDKNLDDENKIDFSVTKQCKKLIDGGIGWSETRITQVETNETTDKTGYYLFQKMKGDKIRLNFEGKMKAKSCNLKEYTSTKSTSVGLINECITRGNKKHGEVIFIGDRRTRILYTSWVAKFANRRAIQDNEKRSMQVNSNFYFYWSEMFESLVEIIDEVRRSDDMEPQLIILGEQFLLSASKSKDVDFDGLEKALEKIKMAFPNAVVFLLGTEGINDLRALQEEYRKFQRKMRK